MKRLELLNNVERAKLLFELVPEEIPDFIDFMKQLFTQLTERKEEAAKDWDNGFMSFNAWLPFAANTMEPIRKYANQLTKQGRLFSDQLFDGYNALWSRHCLQQYADHICMNADFKNAVALFFDQDRTSIAALEGRQEELVRDVDQKITSLAQLIFKYNTGKIFDMDAKESPITLGAPAPGTNPHSKLETIRVAVGNVFLRFEKEETFKPLAEYAGIQVSDKLEILKKLQGAL